MHLPRGTTLYGNLGTRYAGIVATVDYTTTRFVHLSYDRFVIYKSGLLVAQEAMWKTQLWDCFSCQEPLSLFD